MVTMAGNRTVRRQGNGAVAEILHIGLQEEWQRQRLGEERREGKWGGRGIEGRGQDERRQVKTRGL